MDNRITSWHINYSHTGLNQQEHGKLIPDHLCDICKDIDLSNYFETQKISFIHQTKCANSTLDYSVIEQKIPSFLFTACNSLLIERLYMLQCKNQIEQKTRTMNNTP